MRVIVAGLRGIPFIEGGIETHCEHLYPLLTELGCEIELICRNPYVEDRTLVVWKGVKLKSTWSPQKQAWEAFAHSFCALVYAAFKRPDIFHLHAIGPSLLTPIAKLFGLKVVVTHHGFDYEREKWGPVTRSILKLGERFAARYADGLISISDVISQRIAELYGRECTLIPNGVDIPTSAQTTKGLARYGLRKGQYYLVVARYVPEKRIDDAIHAFSKLGCDDWQLVIAGRHEGSDDFSAKIRTLAEKNARVRLVGFQTGSALSELYANAGVLIHPSSHEGLPFTLLEALSHGIRVIISDIPAHTALNLSSCCYFPLGDLNQLANQMARIKNEPWAPEAAATRRRWVAERFSWEQISKKTLSVYNEVNSR